MATMFRKIQSPAPSMKREGGAGLAVAVLIRGVLWEGVAVSLTRAFT
jgi:hypothetical protein